LARPVKKPSDQWKEEIMNAAQSLFVSNGYDETSVNDIMMAVKGAKGTFYQFFETKDQLLEAIVERWASAYEKAVIDILDNKDTSFITKFANMMATVGQMSSKTLGMEVFFRPSNGIMIYKLTKRMTAIITPYLAEVLKTGIDEGLFTLENPHFYASFIINGALGALSTGGDGPNQNIQQNLNFLPQIVAGILRIDVEKLINSSTGGYSPC
jgi:AcrR family transcriptional regulator